MTKFYCAVLLLLLLLPLSAHAQTLTVIEPGDKKLSIKGSIGDDNSFTGNVGVLLEGATGTTQIKLTIYPYALTMANGTGTDSIRPTITPAELMLTPNAPATFQVKVNGVKQPGEYTGKISLTLAGQAQSAAVIVDVTVSASVRPSLALLAENDRLQANLVNCKYDCPLAKLLLTGAAFQYKTELNFEKPVGAPLNISNVTIAVKGDQTKFQVDDKQLSLAPAQSDGSRKYLTLPVTISKDQLPADHYSGNMYLTIDGQTNALKVPVDFNVRSAPLLPIIILLAGILLGRLFKFMQDKGNAIADALETINRLEFRLRNVNPEDAAIIAPMLNDARDLVDQDKVTEAVAAANAASARLATLNELRRIQDSLKGQEEKPAVKAILDDIGKARAQIRFQQDDKAKELLKKIKDALVELETNPGTVDTAAVDLRTAIAMVDSASTNIDVIGNARDIATDRFRSPFVLISGLSNQFRNEATLFVRPLLWLALLIGLLAVGLKALYIDNPTFGASPFTDFFGLVFWGLSTDVASRTLSGLSFKNPSRPAGG